MTNCFTTTHSRARNALDGRGTSETSADGQRRITIRLAKRAMPNHTWEPVEVATLKRREGGRWVIVASGRSVEAGRAFLLGA